MKNKVIATTLGVACHILFLAAISLMAYMLFWGLTRSALPIHWFGRKANIILLLQFPVLHSFFLSRRGRAVLEAPFPKKISRDLVSTTFGVVASLQLIAVFALWVPSGEIWFTPTGLTLYLWTLAYAASWILLAIALKEAGLAMQTGFLGWSAVVTKSKPRYPKPATRGLHSLCRHPIYLSFALVILTAPVWSFDHAALALVWVLYCMIGPLFKERRLVKIHGEDYERYREATPYIIPNLRGKSTVQQRVTVQSDPI